MAVRRSSQLCPVRDAELDEHAAQVTLHRDSGDEKPLCDLGVGQVLCDKGHDPPL
jgi:hypothetical protein